MRLRTANGLAIGLAATVIAVGCSTPDTFTPGEGPVVRGQAVGIDHAAIVDDVGTLSVAFIGGPAGDIMADPCNADYELEVDEATSPPTITVWGLRPSVPPQHTDDILRTCAAIGYSWELKHRFSAEVPGEIQDGSTGEVHFLIRQFERLEPRVLPAGWTVATSDAPSLPPNTHMTRLTDGTSTVFVSATALSGEQQVLLPRFTGPEAAEIVIRGETPAETTNREGVPQLRFLDGTYRYDLSADSGVPLDTLISIAEGLGAVGG